MEILHTESKLEHGIQKLNDYLQIPEDRLAESIKNEQEEEDGKSGEERRERERERERERAVQMRTIIGGGNGGTNLGHLFHFAADQFSDAGALLSAQHMNRIIYNTKRCNTFSANHLYHIISRMKILYHKYDFILERMQKYDLMVKTNDLFHEIDQIPRHSSNRPRFRRDAAIPQSTTSVKSVKRRGMAVS
ncbi:hypothetical protein LXL04_021863 [Taraxacum kok-saghyz]